MGAIYRTCHTSWPGRGCAAMSCLILTVVVWCFYTREYWMIYMGTGFPSSQDLAPPPAPPPLPSASCLSFSVFLSVVASSSLLTKGEQSEGGGAKLYSGEKAWSSAIIQYTVFILHITVLSSFNRNRLKSKLIRLFYSWPPLYSNYCRSYDW